MKYKSSVRPRRGALVLMEPLEARELLATTYYVSPTGNDNAPGNALNKAWKTITKVNTRSFGPGDSILFQGGASFSGTLHFGPDDNGTTGSPIRVGSYGTGRATISSGTGQGLEIQDTDWFEISNLNIVGSGRTTNLGDGVTAWQTGGATTRLNHLYINNVEVRGYGRNGIAVGAFALTMGFKDVRITNTVTRDNLTNGIFFWGDAVGRNEDIYIANVQAIGNSGSPDHSFVSGSGIIIEGSRRVLIERCIATGNGWVGNGGVGIWSHTSDQVTIQYNESYNNRTGGRHDGGGFGFDGGTTNSILQYNYSHGNDGAFVGLYQFFGAPAWGNNIVRYNVSENDGRKNSYGAISTWNGAGTNGLNGCKIYNNTVYMSPATGGAPSALRFMSGGTINFRVHNNIFTTSGGATILRSSDTPHTNLKIQGNNYWTSGGAFKAIWFGVTHNSFPSWQNATGQEILSGGNAARLLNPGVTSPFGGGTIGNANNLSNLTAYKLTSSSALAGAGLNHSVFGVTPVSDFWNSTTPQGSRFDIGAHELPGGGLNGAIPESGGRVDLQAEAASGGAWGTGSASSHVWTTLSDGQAGGGIALVTNPNSGVNVGDATNGPRRDFTIKFTNTGTYYVWVRMNGANGNDDSLHVGFDGALRTAGGGVALTSSQRGAGWVWTNSAPGGARLTVNVGSTGLHTFNLWIREDGTKVDQFILIKDANFNPNGGGINETGGQVGFEAEGSTGGAAGSGSAAGHAWALISDGGASGGNALVSNPNSGLNVGDGTNGPRRDYAINFTTTGTYYVWVRMNGANGNDDSLHVGHNGTLRTAGGGVSLTTAQRGAGWVWTNAAPGGARLTINVISAGVHTLNLWMREDGTKVDRFILTTNAAFVPA